MSKVQFLTNREAPTALAANGFGTDSLPAPGAARAPNRRRIGIKAQLVWDLLAGAARWDHKLAKALGFGTFLISKTFKTPSLLRYAAKHPVYAYILLTTRCSMNCEDCCFADVINNPSIEKTDFSLDEISRISASKIFRNVGRVILFGGEPIMCRSHADVIRFLRNKGLVVQLTTNGMHLSEGILRRLADADLSMLNVTIYEKEEAGKLRNIEKLRRAFDYIREGAFPIHRVGLCYHSTTAADYELAYKFALELGAHHLLFNTTYFSDVNTAFATKAKVESTFFTEYSALCRRIKEERKINLYHPEIDPERPKACPFIETGLTFGPASACSPCCLISPKVQYGTVDDPAKLIQFKDRFIAGQVPKFCSTCPILGTKYV